MTVGAPKISERNLESDGVVHAPEADDQSPILVGHNGYLYIQMIRIHKFVWKEKGLKYCRQRRKG